MNEKIEKLSLVALAFSGGFLLRGSLYRNGDLIDFLPGLIFLGVALIAAVKGFRKK